MIVRRQRLAGAMWWLFERYRGEGRESVSAGRLGAAEEGELTRLRRGNFPD